MARRPALVGATRRQQILEAALDVFAEAGFEGATNKEIAARASVTPGLIYFYFPGKEDLFCAAFDHQAQLIVSHLDFSAELEGEDPPEVALRRIVARFVGSMDAPRGAALMRVLMRESVQRERGDPVPLGQGCGSRGQIRALGKRMSASLRDYLEAQAARGALRIADATVAAQLLTGSLISLLLRRAAGDTYLEQLPRETLIDTITGIFLHGMLARAPLGTHVT